MAQYILEKKVARSFKKILILSHVAFTSWPMDDGQVSICTEGYDRKKEERLLEIAKNKERM